MSPALLSAPTSDTHDAREPGAPEAHQSARRRDGMRQSSEFLRQVDICADFGISDETWRRWVRQGRAPQPVDLPGRPRWRRTEIERFKQGRAEAIGGRKTFFGTAIRRRSA